MFQTENNNNNNLIFPSQNPSNLKERYCTVCHVKTVQNPTNSPLDKDVFMCPNCGVKVGIRATEPNQKGKLTTTFQPAFLQGTSKRIYQPENQPTTRSEEFILQQEEDRHNEGVSDINLKMLKSQGFQITSVDYYMPEAD